MRSAIVSILLGVLAGRAAGGEGWRLVECATPKTADWEAFENSVRTAPPGSVLYTSHPFPKSDAEVYEDAAEALEARLERHAPGEPRGFLQETWDWVSQPFRYLARALEEMSLPAPARRFRAQWRAAEERVLEAQRTRRVRYEVLPVAEWSPRYCQEQWRITSSSLVRVFDDPRGIEIARVAIGADGLLREMRIARLDHKRGEDFLDPRTGQALVPLDTALAFAQQALGAPPTELQYVSTWGTLECSPVIPCVAMKAGGVSYLLKGAVLYRLDFPAQTLSFRKEESPASFNAYLERFARGRERAVTLGDDVMTVAIPISP